MFKSKQWCFRKIRNCFRTNNPFLCLWFWNLNLANSPVWFDKYFCRSEKAKNKKITRKICSKMFIFSWELNYWNYLLQKRRLRKVSTGNVILSNFCFSHGLFVFVWFFFLFKLALTWNCEYLLNDIRNNWAVNVVYRHDIVHSSPMSFSVQIER